MDDISIIIKPLVTEKSTHLQTTRNEYVFQVAQHASKPQIRHAVEHLYSVRVIDVRTMVRKGKPRRAGNRIAKTAEWKRALVKLDENSRIELF